MIKINWKQDYNNEFICPNCESKGLKYDRISRNKKVVFRCYFCTKTVRNSFDIKSKPRKLTALEHKIWKEEYENEFICPKCNEKGLKFASICVYKDKYRNPAFRCQYCKTQTNQFIQVKLLSPGQKVNWQKDYKVGEFASPTSNCHYRHVTLLGTDKKSGKRKFQCKVCNATATEYINITKSNLSRYGYKKTQVKMFSFEDNIWDLRSINVNHQENFSGYLINFNEITVDWLRRFIKQYIQHLCKRELSTKTIKERKFRILKLFCKYLQCSNVNKIKDINRIIVLDFAYDTSSREEMQRRLEVIREFCIIGNTRKWFEIDPDIISDEDYPKRKKSNPDPLSTYAIEQIENHLHKLPEPIFRMWIIAFFSAIRCNELALLKKNCLIQEGDQWKIFWYRNKGKDYHDVPITRTVAKVIQEQIEYIKKLWGSDWEYLFCDYYGISKTDINHPKLKPVPKTITEGKIPLSLALKCLIKSENLREENGKLIEFSSRLVRPSRLTEMFAQGHDLAIVSAWAGHKELATTGTYYIKISSEQIEKEAGHIQKALFNREGKPIYYESLPKSFWKNRKTHKLELPSDHINTPIYGYCGLPLEQHCDKFRACYTCINFVATLEKLPQYIKIRDELRAKESRAKSHGQDVLVEQFGKQADQLEKIITSLQEAA